jgi:hypothetical protein
MKIHKFGKFFGLVALLMLLGWIVYQPPSLPAVKSVTIHIFYSSDFQGYHEGCG